MRSEEQNGVITVEGLDGPVTADDFDEAIAAGIRRMKYLNSDVDQRRARGQAYTLAAAELRYHKLAMHAIRVLGDELRGNDTPLSLLEEAASHLDLLVEQDGKVSREDVQEAAELLDRMRAVIRRLT